MFSIIYRCYVLSGAPNFVRVTPLIGKGLSCIQEIERSGGRGDSLAGVMGGACVRAGKELWKESGRTKKMVVRRAEIFF